MKIMENMTANQARDFFEKSGLSYSDINADSIKALIQFIKFELESNPTDLQMKINEVFQCLITEKGITNAFIYVDGDYFKKREAISFNENGFIGFGGWASSKNLHPIVKGFINWCDTIKTLKDSMRKNGFSRNYIGNSLTFLLTAKKYL